MLLRPSGLPFLPESESPSDAAGQPLSRACSPLPGAQPPSSPPGVQLLSSDQIPAPRLRSVVVCSSSSQADNCSANSDDDGWQIVMSRKSVRRAKFQERNFDRSNVLRERKIAYLKTMKGLCFRCLSNKHLVNNCREPVRCWNCKSFGHLARSCPKTPMPQPLCCLLHFLLSSATRRSYADVVMSSSGNRRGRHEDRPELDHCAMAATQEMLEGERAFISHAVVVWLGENRPRTELYHVIEAFKAEFGVHSHQIQVSEHAPEDWLVFFTDPSLAEAAAARQASDVVGATSAWLHGARTGTQRRLTCLFVLVFALRTYLSMHG